MKRLIALILVLFMVMSMFTGCQSKYKQSVSELQTELNELTEEKARMDEEIGQKEQQIAEKEQQIAELKKELEDSVAEYQREIQQLKKLYEPAVPEVTIPEENMEEYLSSLLEKPDEENLLFVAKSDYATESQLSFVASFAVMYEDESLAIAVEKNPNTTEKVMETLTIGKEAYLGSYKGFFRIIAKSGKSSKALLKVVLDWAEWNSEKELIQDIYCNHKWNS